MHVALWCSIAHFQRLPGLSTVDLLARVASANAAWNSEYVYLDSDIPMFKIVIYTLLSVFENSPSGARAASWLMAAKCLSAPTGWSFPAISGEVKVRDHIKNAKNTAALLYALGF